ncbi:MAG: bifunctional diguanylate cyclase/phosphodiesterase [Lachnospiraceae bacterium]|nr:bifunctional diguanylate cyclase/phosphodiesterase [Lachnospiraceae bacterium]
MEDLKYQIDLLTALNERLLASEKMYRHIAECSGTLFMYFDYKCSPTKVELVGPWDEKVGEKIANHPYDESYMLNLLFDEDQDKFRIHMLEIEREGLESDTIEVRSRNKRYWLSCFVNVTYDDDRNPIEKIISIKDITKIKMNSEELEYLAFYDSLTGVYNRNYFVRKFRDMCERADSEKASVELMFVDIDDFKKINDSIGLLFGDELVQEFGQYLKGFNTEEVIVGRFGSDVFVIAIYNPCGQRSSDVIYRKILERLRHPFMLTNKTEIMFTVSVGVAEYPDAGRTALEVVKNAEIVLYKTKEHGKNGIQYFEIDILNKFIRNVSVEKQLKEAIETEGFQLYYQPQYYAASGNLRGAEALIRWPDPESDGFITSPGEFIPIAEKNGAIIPIGNFVLKEALKTLSDWRNKYHIPMILSINISALSLEKENFVDNISHLISLYGINTDTVELEITESVFINNFEDVIDKIKTLRGLGMRISLDDFGTGFSSLSYLKQLPIDTLKIDKSFIETAVKDESSSIIYESVIQMSQKLGFETVAEGVETREQFNYLREKNIDIIQGYLLGKPISKVEFEKLLIRQIP